MVIVFRDGASRDDIDDAIAAAGLHLVNVLPSDGGRPRQVIAMSNDRRSAVTFVEDDGARVVYAIVRGEAEAALATAVGDSAGARSAEELDGQVREALASLGTLWRSPA